MVPGAASLEPVFTLGASRRECERACSQKTWTRPNETSRWVDKPKCTGKSLESRGRAVAGLFTCDEVAFTTPDLRRVLWFHPLPAYGAEGVMTFDKLVDSGVSDGNAFAVFCAEGKYDERVALAVVLDGTRTVSRDVSSQSKYAAACKVRPSNLAQFEEPDRWGGTIGDTKTADNRGRWALVGAPTCDVYLRTMDACFSALPVEAQSAAKDALRQTTAAWRDIADKAALERACRSSLDAGKQTMSAMCPNVRWDFAAEGYRGGTTGNTPAAGPFDEHQFLPGFVDRFCRGTVSESDLVTLDRLARNRTVSAKALVAIFNIYGAFYSYEFKSERWLNDLYYGSGANHLPASCHPMIRGYRSARDIPVHFGKARDRVRSTWTAVK